MGCLFGAVGVKRFGMREAASGHLKGGIRGIFLWPVQIYLLGIEKRL